MKKAKFFNLKRDNIVITIIVFVISIILLIFYNRIFFQSAIDYIYLVLLLIVAYLISCVIIKIWEDSKNSYGRGTGI